MDEVICYCPFKPLLVKSLGD